MYVHCYSLPVTTLNSLAVKGMERDSTDLVPGDIVNLSSSQLSIVPSDLFLLSGDAIVNESMLTGESIPVSKIPVKDDDLVKWKDGKGENPKVFLYGGTKIVRIRAAMSVDSSVGKPALALVARTGEALSGLCYAGVQFSLRFQHHQGSASAIDAIPQADRIQVLSGLDEIHWFSHVYRSTRLQCQRRQLCANWCTCLSLAISFAATYNT